MVMQNGRVVDVDVAGPLHDKFACYGALKMAEKIIDAFQPPAKPQLALPHPREVFGVNRGVPG